MMNLIKENSSEEEFEGKGLFGSNNLGNSISSKILKRADELEKVHKISEDQRLKRLFQAADEKLEKSQKFARKLMIK